VAFTADVVTVPIWVVFVAWGSFVFVGGGVSGWVRSVSSNIVGATFGIAAEYLAGGMISKAAQNTVVDSAEGSPA